MSTVTLTELAQMLKMDVILVRDILTEKPGLNVERATMDLVFNTARKVGYDFKKLKIGKRMNLRKEVIEDILKAIEEHPKWKRKEIVAYLNSAQDMVERVHKRAFAEEFTD